MIKQHNQKLSAFDRINVRRLFITLEKAIVPVAKFQLFEFNDEFTRAQFRNLVELPFLRDIQGRRGMTDFSVVCDESNNTLMLLIETNLGLTFLLNLLVLLTSFNLTLLFLQELAFRSVK